MALLHNAFREQHFCLRLGDIILRFPKWRPSLQPQLRKKNMTFKDNSEIDHECREALRSENKYSM